MTVATYAPRVPVHADRKGAIKSGPNRLLVLHTSEGGEGPNAAENLAGYLASPGDRPSSSGGRYGSSYHAITDTDRILPAVPDNQVAYAAAGANHDGIHLCFPGRAGQTRAQWLDTDSRPLLRVAAGWLIDKSREHGIPLLRRTVPEVRADARGVCDHHDVSLAFGKSDHTDVGDGFPWDVLWDDVNALLAPPPPTDEGVTMRVIKMAGKPGAYLEVTQTLGLSTAPVKLRYKIWLPTAEARDAMVALYGRMVELAKIDFIAAGPVAGKRPAGTDTYGVLAA